jgi:norsolorinic acid ketoreductase
MTPGWNLSVFQTKQHQRIFKRTFKKPSMSQQSYLISGSNRGIGLELVKLLASRPETIVFAGVREPSKATALQTLADQHSNVHIIKLDSSSVADAQEAARYVTKVAGALDVVIANAGIAQNWENVANVDPAALTEHFRVNTLGPLILFQALYPVLLKGETRKFVTISSHVGMITDMINAPETAYGTSKAALNFLTKRIHLEHSGEGFIAFPVHPGYVNTDMGQAAAPTFGMTEFPVSPADSAKGILEVVDAATASQSGRFLNYDGTENQW